MKQLMTIMRQNDQRLKDLQVESRMSRSQHDLAQFYDEIFKLVVSVVSFNFRQNYIAAVRDL